MTKWLDELNDSCPIMMCAHVPWFKVKSRLTLWRLLLPYNYSCKSFCARPG